MSTDAASQPIVDVIAAAGRGLLGQENAGRILGFLRRTAAPVTAGQVLDGSDIVMASPYALTEISSALKALVAHGYAGRAGHTRLGARRYALTAAGLGRS